MCCGWKITLNILSHLVLGVESAALELRKVLASVDGPHGLAASLSGEGAAAAAAQRNAKQATQALEVATALEAVAGLGAGLEVCFLNTSPFPSFSLPTNTASSLLLSFAGVSYTSAF